MLEVDSNMLRLPVELEGVVSVAQLPHGSKLVHSISKYEMELKKLYVSARPWHELSVREKHLVEATLLTLDQALTYLCNSVPNYCIQNKTKGTNFIKNNDQ